ncbi:MAG: HD domain-containing protein [Thermovirga sp.]|nr:HD domain-containing protein [Thermovirga sp.]
MLSKLIQLGQQASSSLEVDTIIKTSLENILEIVDSKWCAIGLLDEETGKIVLRENIKQDGKSQFCSTEIPAEEDCVRKVMKNGSPLTITNIADSSLSCSLMSKCLGYLDCNDTGAIIPIKGRTKTLGILVTYYSSAMISNKINYLSIIANQIGLAIENAQLYESLQRQYVSVVNALAATLEAKDAYTKGHSLRVATWSRAVAKEMGLSDKQQEMIYVGGLLHDIGKVGVSERILLKGDKLTAEEKEAIQKHPLIGAKILEPGNLPEDIIKAVMYHHENYDGSGYPEGLTGEEIPVLARIINVVDAYDAMTSDRPYRSSYTQNWATEELDRNAGKQFDPTVIEAFKKLISRGELGFSL